MRVLHLVGGDLSGGAARGAYWLHNALLEQGVDSWLLCDTASRIGNEENVSFFCDGYSEKIKKACRILSERMILSFFNAKKKNGMLFSSGIFGVDFTKHPLYLEADIIHLHWINGAYISPSIFRKIKKPVVWTVRDMWPFSGGCHYSLGCDKYKTKCCLCPTIDSSRHYDISTYIQKMKRKYINKLNITAVGISNWISDCIKESLIFSGKNVITIPNTIDSDLFKPVEKRIAKDFFSIKNKSIIAVGAQNTEDLYKGMDELHNALCSLKNKNDYHILIFGNTNKKYWDTTGISYTLLGFLNDIYSLQLVYSAADVFVAPSKYEAFGKTIAEAMSCQTPVVAFNTTGPIDIIDHCINGYLAEPYSYIDLAFGIEWVVNNSKKLNMGGNAREKIETVFSPTITASAYISLYDSLLRVR